MAARLEGSLATKCHRDETSQNSRTRAVRLEVAVRPLPDDPDTLDLLPSFCLDWLNILDVRGWPLVLAARDPAALHRLGHTANGSFSQFGLPDGAVMGNTLIACSRADDWDGAIRTVAALRLLVTEVLDQLGETAS